MIRLREGLDLNTLERIIAGYYRAETAGLRCSPRLWQALEHRLGDQDRPSLMEGLAARLMPGVRPSQDRRQALLAAVSAVAGIVVLGIAAMWMTGPRTTEIGRAVPPSPPTAAAQREGDLPIALEPATPPAAATPIGAPIVAYGTPSVEPVESPASEVATPQPEVTPPPQTAIGVPALKTGTIEEAEIAVGIKVRLPQYLPAGTERDGPARYYAWEGRGMVSVSYRVGLEYFAVESIKQPEDEMPVREGTSVTVGQLEGVLYTQPKEPSDPLPPVTEIVWRDGELTMRVAGDLPPEELLKVARSLY